MKRYKKLSRKILAKRGWYSPDGQEIFISIENDHTMVANSLLKFYYPNWDWKHDPFFARFGNLVYSTIALESKNWIRIADDNHYSIWALNGTTRSGLIELLSKLPSSKWVLIEVATGRNLSGIVKEVLEELW